MVSYDDSRWGILNIEWNSFLDVLVKGRFLLIPVLDFVLYAVAFGRNKKIIRKIMNVIINN